MGPQGPAGSDALWNVSGDNMYHADGSVGIGTGAPDGTLHVVGTVRQGNETGTTDPADVNGNGSHFSEYRGFVVRRILSRANTNENIVADALQMTLERDGTNGGLVVRWPANTQYGNVIMGVRVSNTGAVSGFYKQLTEPESASSGSFAVCTDADASHHIQIQFGNAFQGLHHTEVQLFRNINDFIWLGSVRSTVNQ